MHSIRRAALRAASSSAPLAMGMSRQQMLSLAMRQTKASARPVFALASVRAFSQSARVAQDGEKQVVEEATKAYERETTTAEAATEFKPARQSAHGVYIKNMTYEATEDHLREAFSKYGAIQEIRIARDDKGLSKGFGFVYFADKDSADRVVEEANDSFWHGRRIFVAHARPKPTRSPREPRSDSEPSRSLYIGNIPYETSDADLNRMFRELENVTDVRVAVDRNTGWPRGFAHADFADVESAQNALNKLRDTSFKGRQLRVDFSAKPTRGPSRRDQESRRDDLEEL